MSSSSTTLHGRVSDARHAIERRLGGPARASTIALLAAVLGLDTADKATVSAIAGGIKGAFDIGNAEIGALIAIVSFVGALLTLPIGILVDRFNRKMLLVVAILLWTAATVVSGLATSYTFLLVVRVALGVVTATAAPTIASLTGDFFPAAERARIYGLILGGELAGIGIGFFVSGEVSALAGWRWPFFVMAVPSIALAWAIWRYLPEPARGGQSWIRPGDDHVRSAEEAAGDDAPQDDAGGTPSPIQEQIGRRSRAAPRQDLVLHENPVDRSLLWAIGYALRIPTYVLLIVASSLGYYFFSGVRAFGMIYLTGHYGLARSIVSALVFVVGVGALAGVVLGGRLSEWLLQRGRIDARIVVPGASLLVATVFFGGGIWTTSPYLGTGLLFFAALFLAAANPPIDAARLDIMHPRLWGRAEAGRMALRGMMEGAAPLLIGLVSGWIGGGNNGLKWALMIMLVPLVLASGLAIPARRTYPRDVATAAESVRQTGQSQASD